MTTHSRRLLLAAAAAALALVWCESAAVEPSAESAERALVTAHARQHHSHQASQPSQALAAMEPDQRR
jgi:hypothetical protein